MTITLVRPTVKKPLSPVVVNSSSDQTITHVYMATLLGIAMEREIKEKVTEGNLSSKLVRAGVTPKTMEDIFYGRYELGATEMLRILDILGLSPMSFYNRLNLYIREVTLNRNMIIMYNPITPITDKTPRSQIETILHGRGSLYQQHNGTCPSTRNPSTQ